MHNWITYTNLVCLFTEIDELIEILNNYPQNYELKINTMYAEDYLLVLIATHCKK